MITAMVATADMAAELSSSAILLYFLQTRAAEPSLRHEVTEVMDAMVATGLTVLRTWAFNDGESQWNALQPRPGGPLLPSEGVCLGTSKPDGAPASEAVQGCTTPTPWRSSAEKSCCDSDEGSLPEERQIVCLAFLSSPTTRLTAARTGRRRVQRPRVCGAGLCAGGGPAAAAAGHPDAGELLEGLRRDAPGTIIDIYNSR